MKAKYRHAFMLPTILVIYFAIIHITKSRTKCFFKNLVGIPCPGCGLTRAYEMFFTGNIRKAFYYHPLFLIIPLLVMLYILNLIIKNYKLKKISEIIYLISTMLFISLYVVRFIKYFPKIQPMNFYERGLIPFIVHKIKIMLK
jgi:cytochrome bd-type quinol oxidase subunit 2